MNAITRVLLCSAVMCFCIAQVRAQQTKYHFETGLNLGTLVYQGDLVESPFGSFKGTRPMFNVWIAKPFTPYLSWRANLTIGSLSADESKFTSPSWKQKRNFAFSTSLTEVSALLHFNLYGDNDKENYHTLTPYIMAGAGLSFLSINRDWSRLDTNAINYKSFPTNGLAIDSQHVLPRVLPVIPIGVGIKWMVNSTIAVNAEATMRVSFSDYIDGFSYAANPKRTDAYYGISLGVSFVLGGDGIKCPRVGK
ncbi:MAG: DUF6089 family protein [Sediminibacterium sp.]